MSNRSAIPAALALLILIPLAAIAARADSLRLRDGVAVHGTLLGADTRELRFLTDEGLIRNYRIGDVNSVVFAPSAESAAKEPEAPEIQSPRVRSSDGNISTEATTADVVVPGGTVLTVRMIDAIDSDENEPGEIFHASLANDLIVDNQGKIEKVVIGVGGFLGMGEHNIAVSFDQLKWVNEPVKTSSAADTRPGGAGGMATPSRPTMNCSTGGLI